MTATGTAPVGGGDDAVPGDARSRVERTRELERAITRLRRARGLFARFQALLLRMREHAGLVQGRGSERGDGLEAEFGRLARELEALAREGEAEGERTSGDPVTLVARSLLATGRALSRQAIGNGSSEENPPGEIEETAIRSREPGSAKAQLAAVESELLSSLRLVAGDEAAAAGPVGRVEGVESARLIARSVAEGYRHGTHERPGSDPLRAG